MADATPAQNPLSTHEAWQLLLIELQYKEGDLRTLSADAPFMLQAPDAWIIYRGAVDLFYTRLTSGKAAGARRHLTRLYTDALLLGLAQAERDYGLLVVPTPQTRILRLPYARLHEIGQRLENIEVTALMLDAWLLNLTSALMPPLRPRHYTTPQLGASTTYENEAVAYVPQGVQWLRLTRGSAAYMGEERFERITQGRTIPLTPYNWLLFNQDDPTADVTARSTGTWLESDPAWSALADFHGLLLDHLDLIARGQRQRESQQIQQRRADDDVAMQQTVADLASVWGRKLTTQRFSGLNAPELVALNAIAAYLAVPLRLPQISGGADVVQIARHSRLQTRNVTLVAGQAWWRNAASALLVTYNGDMAALIPNAAGGYDLVTRENRAALKPAQAAQVSPYALAFYRPLPHHDGFGLLDLLRFGLQDVRPDVTRLLLMGAFGGLLALLPPIATGVIFNTLLPTGDVPQLVMLGAVLVVSALAVGIFNFVRALALLRIEVRFDATAQAAVWDHLLHLPARFFRDYNAGDLADRALGITAIKQIVTGTVAAGIISGIFSLFNFVLLFLYDVPLAFFATGLALLTGLLVFGVGRRLLTYQRRSASVQGRLAGRIVQLLTGITKLRVAAAEAAAFGRWADDFAEQKRIEFRAGALQNLLFVVLDVYPVLATVVLFAAISGRPGVQAGTFLAFYAAFTTFLGAALGLGQSLVTLLQAVPLYERLQPILRQAPEVQTGQLDPGELSGRIEVSRVTFRYNAADQTPTVQDVSFSASAGQMIAVVGPSGSGKSTVLRLLLGFEQPETGEIYYDGQALGDLDLHALRRQVGVVLQHSQLMTGDIYRNICGAQDLPLEQVWEAARMAGIAADIEALPMGLQTVISEGGSTFSGGQRQRLMIARALANQPRILFFDEATSALDDQTQALVTENLLRLDATRVVIAHRLSTVQDADQIIVMDGGRVVEQGTYAGLMRANGVFAALAARQLA
jgi:NHLM bacteriocin system ABC transporter ATP-binding protein